MVDRKKLLQEAPPFDGKKNCWVVEEKDGFVAAEIVSSKGDEVTVQLSSTHQVSTCFIRPSSLPLQLTLTD